MVATFIYPTDTKRVTSHFRTKERPNHHGTDFAEPGYHEIKAAATGEVVKSYRSSSYGECIIIRHKIKGDTWETLYAHMREGSRKFKVGDKVKQGQVIGVMGSTGDSTGQHLHFELHKGTWNINKTNAVDPMEYVGKDLYPEKEKGTYTVKAGDTFWGLEKENEWEHGTLQRLNPNVDPRKLQVGQKIKIPSGSKNQPSVDFKVGQKVKVKKSAQKYATGENIPGWVNGRKYTIQQVKRDRVLLKEIVSWVYKKDVE